MPFDPEEGYAQVMQSINRRRHWRISAICAAVIVPAALCVGTLVFVDRNISGGKLFEKPLVSDIVVPNGDRTNVIFPDGSRVCLNSGSTVSYPDRFVGKTREISLNGEGYFNIQTNPKRPFIVHFDCGEVKVTGTAFNLSTYEQDRNVVIALDNGKVAMTLGSDTFDMKPGDVIYYDRNTKKVRMTTGGSTQKSKWMDGVITFKSATLEEIAVSLGRQFNVEFAISPQVDTNVLYTFTSSRAELSQILDELALIAAVKISRENGLVTVDAK